MAKPSTVLGVWRMVQSGLIDLSGISVRRVGLDNPASAMELAATATGLDFVVLVPTDA